MTWQEYVLAVVASCAWPAVVVAGVLIIRRELRRGGRGVSRLAPFQKSPEDPRTGACTWGYSTCFRCRTSWDRVASHSTETSDHSCSFPLCELCWRELGTPEARLPFYAALVDEWVTEHGMPLDDAARRRELLDAAVRAGG